MEIVYDEIELERFVATAAAASPDHPVLIDRFLEGAIEVDVDAVCDGADVFVGAVMEHIEEAGVHSGDSSCQIPPATLSDEELDEVEAITATLARRLGVYGLINLQLAVKDERIWVLEANPRASRTVPFVSKAIGVPLAKIAARIMVGKKLKELGLTREILPKHVSVKEAVFPFNKFPGVDTILGPEMKSTGEVMGIDDYFGLAFAKAQLGSGMRLPKTGRVFISVRDDDKTAAALIARRLYRIGFQIVATVGTARNFEERGIPTELVNKVQDGSPHIGDRVKNGEIAIVINTPEDARSHADSYAIRRYALDYQVPYFTTMAGADAAADAIEYLMQREFEVKPLQEYETPRLP
jgi:carbamoyl-phosphate synthase large subunit